MFDFLGIFWAERGGIKYEQEECAQPIYTLVPKERATSDQGRQGKFLSVIHAHLLVESVRILILVAINYPPVGYG